MATFTRRAVPPGSRNRWRRSRTTGPARAAAAPRVREELDFRWRKAARAVDDEQLVELAAEQLVAADVRHLASADAGDAADVAVAPPVVGHGGPVGRLPLEAAHGLELADDGA